MDCSASVASTSCPYFSRLLRPAIASSSSTEDHRANNSLFEDTSFRYLLSSAARHVYFVMPVVPIFRARVGFFISLPCSSAYVQHHTICVLPKKAPTCLNTDMKTQDASVSLLEVFETPLLRIMELTPNLHCVLSWAWQRKSECRIICHITDVCTARIFCTEKPANVRSGCFHALDNILHCPKMYCVQCRLYCPLQKAQLSKLFAIHLLIVQSIVEGVDVSGAASQAHGFHLVLDSKIGLSVKCVLSVTPIPQLHVLVICLPTYVYLGRSQARWSVCFLLGRTSIECPTNCVSERMAYNYIEWHHFELAYYYLVISCNVGNTR